MFLKGQFECSRDLRVAYSGLLDQLVASNGEFDVEIAKQLIEDIPYENPSYSGLFMPTQHNLGTYTVTHERGPIKGVLAFTNSVTPATENDKDTIFRLVYNGQTKRIKFLERCDQESFNDRRSAFKVFKPSYDVVARPKYPAAHIKVAM